MDPNNPVVKLCAEGMMAEGEGDPVRAAALFHQAWEASVTELDRAVAAHYVARHAGEPTEVRRWNGRALEHAERSDSPEARQFLPSLLQNLGKSLEDTGAHREAAQAYERGHAALPSAPEGPKRDLLARGIEAGRQRMTQRPLKASNSQA